MLGSKDGRIHILIKNSLTTLHSLEQHSQIDDHVRNKLDEVINSLEAVLTVSSKIHEMVEDELREL